MLHTYFSRQELAKVLRSNLGIFFQTKFLSIQIMVSSDLQELIEVVLTALIMRFWFWCLEQNQNQTLGLYFNNLVLFVWFWCDTEEQTEPEPFKYNLALVLFLVLFDHQFYKCVSKLSYQNHVDLSTTSRCGSVCSVCSNKEIRARARTQTQLATEPEYVLKQL